MLLLIVGGTVLTYALTLSYLLYGLRQNALSDGQKLVNTAASQKANEIQAVLNEDIAISRAMAVAMKQYVGLPEAQRERMKQELLKGVLESNPKYEATWVSLELGFIDPTYTKPYGRQRSTCYYENGVLRQYEELANMQGDAATGLYTEIKFNPVEKIGEPYEYSGYGGKTNETLLGLSPSAPIIIDGRFAGLIGMDMLLDGFRTMSDITFFDRGAAFLLSNKGVVVSHEVSEKMSQPVDSLEFFGNVTFALKDSIAAGRTFSVRVFDAAYGEDVLISFAPIHIGRSTEPWAVGVQVPVSEVMRATSLKFNTSLAVALLGLLALGFVASRIGFGLSRSVTRSNALLKDLSKGDLDPDKKLKINSTDELGEMAVSVNYLMDELIRKANFAYEIGQGNLNVDFQASGPSDVLGLALLRMRENLLQVISETNAVVRKAVSEGDLSSARIQTGQHLGGWSELTGSINKLLESISMLFYKVNGIANAMATGDLTVRFDADARGDVQTLAENLNMALDNVSDLIRQITENARVVGESSTEMQTLSEEMTTNTREIASSISQMSHGAQNQVSKVDDASNLVEGILRSSNEMGDHAESITLVAQAGVNSSEKGLKLVKKVGFSIKDIAAFSAETYESIQVLTHRSQEISRALSVITDIASQTNLLALNAAIEAAQAGDAGRGFAVVAEEIRKLAEGSKKSAKEIEKLVTDVQTDVSAAALAIEHMKQSVQGGQDASASASEAFNEIAESSARTMRMSEEILTRVKGQIDDIKNVVTLTESVVVIAEQTAAGTEEIASSATELSAGMDHYVQRTRDLTHVASELTQRINKFRLK